MGHTGVGWGGSCRSGRGHTGVGWVGHAVKQAKNDSPQNQDSSQPKSFLDRVQNPNFEYKNNNNNYYFIIIIVLHSQLYQKLITRCSLHKNLNGMIITLAPTGKSRKVACVLNGTEMLSTKATTKINLPSPTLSRKQLTIFFSEEKTEHPTCDRSNYSVNIFTAHSTPVYCTPPYISHPTPPLHDLLHAYMTHNPCPYITPPASA